MIQLLEISPPLWGSKTDWDKLVAALWVFERRWGDAAEAAGWSPLQLYGLDPDPPYARVGRMGAPWLACMRAHCVVSVDPVAIRVVARTAARLSIYRPEAGAVLAWTL